MRENTEGDQALNTRTSPSKARPRGGAPRRAPPRSTGPGRISLTTQPSPVMQVHEYGSNLIPSAKCSRVVSRSPPPGLPSQRLRLIPQCYGGTFWEKLNQRPSPTWMEEQYIPSLLRGTGGSQPGVYLPQGLLPPEMLFKRRRRPYLAGKQQRPGSIPARVRAVTYHLEDLRRRQRIIDELKEAQRGSSGAASEPLVPGEAGCRLLSITEHPNLEEEKATYPQEEDHSLSPGRAQLLWSPWSPPSPGGTLSLQEPEPSSPLEHCHGQ